MDRPAESQAPGGLKVTSTEFVRECGVTDRCILEDIAYGKNVLAWPIEFNHQEKA